MLSGVVDACGAETAFAAQGLRQGFDDLPVYLGNLFKDHLGNPVAIINDKGFCPEIDKNDLYLAPIVGIDCAGCIENSDAMFYSETTSGSHFRLVSFRDAYRDARRQQ